jgi:hypothetical protein
MVNDMFNRKPDKGRIWHQALTTLQTSRIRKVHAAIGSEVLGLFEYFEAGFLQELHLDEAIADYEKVALVFAAWKRMHPDANVPEQKEVLSRIMHRESR